MLSIIIPCYNEAKNLPLIFSRLSEVLKGRSDVEVVLVNNGSKDDSASVFESELKTASPSFRVEHVKINQGYGFGILSGLAAAKGDVLAWTHADMQTDPNDVLKAYDLYRSKSEEKILVKGKRYNRALLDVIFSYGMQVIASLALKTKLDDINAQPKLFSRAFYETYVKHYAPHDFSLDLFVLYQAMHHGYRIYSLPVYFAKRLHGEAKGGGGGLRNKYKLTKRTLQYIFELRKKLAS